MELLPTNYRFPSKPDTSKKDWDVFRRTVLEKNSYKCHFCDTPSKKYLQCLRVSKDKYAPVCFLCKTIITTKPKYALMVVHSKTTQRDIVRVTNRYIKNKKCIPNQKFIDKTVRKVSLSVADFATILKSKKKLPDEIKNLKIIFNNRLKLEPMGIKEQDIEDNDDLEEYQFNNDTEKFIKNMFQDTTKQIINPTTKIIDDPYLLDIQQMELEIKYNKERLYKIKKYYQIFMKK
jgi:hypothetical protein